MTGMTDHELLVRAAAAAGIDGEMEPTDIGFWIGGDIGRRTGACWNPLTNDGDALRLAVKLRMEITATGVAVYVNLHGFRCKETVGDNPDIYAATRRAIVRAAASLATTEAG